jgi:AbiV family abortive infection protein
MEEKLLNLNKLNHLASTALRNGIRIHFDSILLFRNRSYSTAYFLAVLAIEEIGKSFMIDHFWWHSVIDGRSDPIFEKEWFKILFNHKVKQRQFAYFIDGPMPNIEIMKDIQKGSLELLKQNALYVGIGKNGKVLDVDAKINNPLKMSSKNVRHLITLTNSKLLEFTLLQLKQVGGFDSKAMISVLDFDLYLKLKKGWPYIEKTTKPRIKKLELLSDETEK